ncbi:ankyrin repeat protein [Elusimicrobium posterum]|uniref:hypothetical protein n=1 Tax=Elusimicrobium posterum TaxID=3116653 RepID=UPI003C771F8F
MKYFLTVFISFAICTPALFAQTTNDIEREIRDYASNIRNCETQKVYSVLANYPKFANLHAQSEDYNTPLVGAIENDCLAIAKILIENGANVNYGNNVQKKYPLILAAVKHKRGDGNYDWPDLLADIAPLAVGTKTNRNEETALIAAAKRAIPANVQTILENVANPGITKTDLNGYSARMWAANNNDLRTMSLINQYDQNQNDLKKSLNIAKQYGFSEMVKLIEKEINN